MKNICRRTSEQFLESTSVRSNIIKLCCNGSLRQALRLLFSCGSERSLFDLTLYSSIFQLCIDDNAENEGRIVHKHLCSRGLTPDLHLGTKMIIFYAKCGDVDTARELFDKMNERSHVTWTALISGYSRHGYPRESLGLFTSMHRVGFKANQFTYGSVLRACTQMGCLYRGKQVQANISKNRFSENVFVQSALLDLHLKCGMIADAQYIFDKMSNRDVVSWNSVISGCAVNGLLHSSFGFFFLMIREGMTPDHFTFASILKVCGGSRDVDKVIQIHGFILRMGFTSHDIVIGSLIDAYAKCRSMNDARILYDSMETKDLISLTALLTGYAQDRSQTIGALELISKINQSVGIFDDFFLCSVLSICANTAFLSMGRQVHALIAKSRPISDVAVANSLIDMYSKSGSIDDAQCLFDEMEKRNVISWTSLISGYGKNGNGVKAVALFENMECNGLKPNDVTFLSLLFSCSHSGLLNRGLELFDIMLNKYGISPRNEHYSCLIDMLARGGRLEEACDIICRINGNPKSSIWVALLNACRIYENKHIAEKTAGYLFHLEPEKTTSYIILANIYAASGLWKESRNTRVLMEKRGLSKMPGSSFLHFIKKNICILT